MSTDTEKGFIPGATYSLAETSGDMMLKRRIDDEVAKVIEKKGAAVVTYFKNKGLSIAATTSQLLSDGTEIWSVQGIPMLKVHPMKAEMREGKNGSKRIAITQRIEEVKRKR